MSFRVLHPGAFSILVDRGRPNARSLGVPLGGAADRAAYDIGNGLIGNPSNCVALEVTLSGPTLVAESNISACLFGAPFHIQIDGQPIDAARVFQIKSGEALKIGGTSEGARGYLCVAGGFESKVILSSRSALAPIVEGETLVCGESFGSGRSLAHADARTLLLPSPKRSEGKSEESLAALRARKNHDRIDVLRIIDGPQADWFKEHHLYETSWTVSPASNRMGARLQGKPLVRQPGELISEAVAPGAIQITNEGLPIILGVDGQTIGGYPKIAHVIRADLDRVAQLRPSGSVRFLRVTLEEAETIAEKRGRCLQRWLAVLGMSDVF